MHKFIALIAFFFAAAPNPTHFGNDWYVKMHSVKSCSAKKTKIRFSVSAHSLHHLAGKWTEDVIHAARKAHISPRLVASVLHVENRGGIDSAANRVSYAGAIGPMQLMPATAWNELHVNPWNPRENIEGGARYLAQLLRQFHGNKRLALIAYNAGPYTVEQGNRPSSAVYYASEVLHYVG